MVKRVRQDVNRANQFSDDRLLITFDGSRGDVKHVGNRLALRGRSVQDNRSVDRHQALHMRLGVRILASLLHTGEVLSAQKQDIEDQRHCGDKQYAHKYPAG